MLYEHIPADWQDRLVARSSCVALDADYRELDAAIVAAAHQAGYKVLTYTANEPAIVTPACGLGRRRRHHRRNRCRPARVEIAGRAIMRAGSRIMPSRARRCRAAVSRSSMGRFNNPATTPSAIARYHTTS